MRVRGVVGAGLFRAIQAALLPLAAAAYLMGVPKLLLYSRRTGVSATQFASLYTRYMQHNLGTRRDDPVARLMAVMPNVSQEALRLGAAPTLVAHLLTGFVPRFYRYPYEGEPPMRHQQTARTSFHDAALRRHLPGIEQLVVLGAGFDTRVFRLPPEEGVRCFEVDMPRTQAFKIRMLKESGLTGGPATYVAADFGNEDWFGQLVAAGYDPARPTFFLWESVMMYLDRASVEGTLRRIAGAAPGSVVAFDYFSADTIASRSLFMRYARATTRLVGEPFTFGIDNTPPARESVAEFLGDFGLVLEEHRMFGTERISRTGSRQRCAPAGFATALVGRST
ncbi:class I SAM-dependent methyltransferase [Arthrobacter sp. 92]|jgi:methyltransferase (TIGR00027 family)|uniref:class I SAM-dependent methyltransferase n=1 Tax=Arthrobacter sp. 92 TaxID=3418175 RepID=UPI003D01ECDD